MTFCPVNPSTTQNKKSKVEIQHIFGQSPNNTSLAQSLFSVLPCSASCGCSRAWVLCEVAAEQERLARGGEEWEPSIKLMVLQPWDEHLWGSGSLEHGWTSSQACPVHQGWGPASPALHSTGFQVSRAGSIIPG